MNQEGHIFSLKWKDAVKGVIMSFLAAFLMSIYGVINSGGWPTNGQWQEALKIGATAFVAYILKNFFTNSQDQFMKKEPSTENKP